MSTVIKAGQAGSLLQRLSTVDLVDYLSEAREVIAKAEQRAVEIIAHAQRDAQRAQENAYETGYQAGFEKGHIEGTTKGHQAALQESLVRFQGQQSTLVSAMEQALTEIDQIKEDLAVAAERDLLEFAVAMAARLTFAIGALHRESAMQNLRRALRLVGSKSDLTVRVHPDDLASMETFAESVVKKMGTARAVNLVPDTTVAPGGCTVGAAEIEVDASLETQIDEMVSLLLGKRNVDG